MERGTCWLNKYQQEIIRVISNCVWLESFSRSRPVNTNRGIFRKANLFYLLLLLSAALSVHLVLRLHILCLLMRDAAKFSVWVVVCCQLKCEVMSWQEIILLWEQAASHHCSWLTRTLSLPATTQSWSMLSSLYLSYKRGDVAAMLLPRSRSNDPECWKSEPRKSEYRSNPKSSAFLWEMVLLTWCREYQLLWFSRCAVSHIFYEIRNLHA